MFSDSFKDNPEVLLLLVLIYSLMGLLFYFCGRRERSVTSLTRKDYQSIQSQGMGYHVGRFASIMGDCYRV